MFKQKLAEDQIVEAIIGHDDITGAMKDPKPGAMAAPAIPFATVFQAGGDPRLAEDLGKFGVKYAFKRPSSPVGGLLLSYVLPLALFGGFYFLVYRRMGSGAGGPAGILGVGKSKATAVKAEEVGVTYEDGGGADEAIAELQEIIQFLKTPE
jgi:cell division protease FtsH